MFFKRHKKLVISLCMLLMVVVAGVTGFLMAESEPRIVTEPEEMEAALPAGVDNSQITKETKITWLYDYDMCAHELTETTLPDGDMVGLGFSQLSSKYPGTRILSFSVDEVVLKNSFVCYCPEHYILKKSGEQLAVFRTEAGTGTQNAYINISIDFNTLEPEMQEMLISGCVFSTMRDLEQFLAGFNN